MLAWISFGEGLTHTGLCVVLHDVAAQSSGHGRPTNSYIRGRHVDMSLF
jgi:hypothetical protein